MPATWRNESGRPLSSINWLADHHQAKIENRSNFVKAICNNQNIQSIVDLGCGPGLWLDLFNRYLPEYVEFIGMDSDLHAIDIARKRSEKWNRKKRFIADDFSLNLEKIPVTDLILAFNIFSYLGNPEEVLLALRSRLSPNGRLVIRQFDGATIRFGPLDQKNRIEIETSLYSSVGISDQFHYYDLDRVYSILSSSSFKEKKIYFEKFEAISPYSAEFSTYFTNTIDWIAEHVSEHSKNELNDWTTKYLCKDTESGSYFSALDLVAILS